MIVAIIFAEVKKLGINLPCKMQLMTIEAIRIKLHGYISIAPYDKLKSIYDYLLAGLKKMMINGLIAHL